jgi:hypothetical protein
MNLAAHIPQHAPTLSSPRASARARDHRLTRPNDLNFGATVVFVPTARAAHRRRGRGSGLVIVSISSVALSGGNGLTTDSRGSEPGLGTPR